MYVIHYTLQDSLTQWDLIISLLYQSAMDYLFCQHSLSLEVVGGVIGDFDISQFAVDYQSSLNVDNEVIDKGVSIIYTYHEHKFLVLLLKHRRITFSMDYHSPQMTIFLPLVHPRNNLST